jgi:hypothetical protein
MWHESSEIHCVRYYMSWASLTVDAPAIKSVRDVNQSKEQAMLLVQSSHPLFWKHVHEFPNCEKRNCGVAPSCINHK